MKVALIGMAGGWDRAPWDDATWEKWGLNDGYQLWGEDRMAKCARWWELHGDTELTRVRRPVDHFDYLTRFDGRIYFLHGAYPAPNWKRLNVPMLAREGRDYFACTTAYQIALALSEAVTDLGVYGMPFGGNREAIVERACVAYWLGLAEGRGVHVTVEHDAVVGLLAHPYHYALDDDAERHTTYLAVDAFCQHAPTWLAQEAKRLHLLEVE